MLVSGSNCCEWNFNKEIGGGETLDRMGNDEISKADAEEGEISDSASVEAKVSSKPKVEDGGRRVWTMQDLYQYQVCRGYPSASGLYNLAWAQAVQNKPLNEIFVMDVDPDKRSSSLVSSSGKVEKVVIDDSGDEMEVKVVDVEKEEGELEEGEIDLDSDPAQNEDQTVVDGSEIELAEQVKTIREELESVTVVYAEKSFEGACSQLQSSIQRFQKMVFGSNALTKEPLVQLCFTAIEVLNSVMELRPFQFATH